MLVHIGCVQRVCRLQARLDFIPLATNGPVSVIICLRTQFLERHVNRVDAALVLTAKCLSGIP